MIGLLIRMNNYSIVLFFDKEIHIFDILNDFSDLEGKEKCTITKMLITVYN